VGEAGGPEEPVRFAGDLAPDVVIVHAADGGSGAECVRRLRAMPLDAPILLLSAHRSRGLNEQARESGAQGTVLKTGSVAELLRALRALVRGDSSFDRNYPARPGAQSVLSRREREVLQLVARGATNREIAEALGIGAETVKTVLARTAAKLGVRGRNKTAAAAHGLGLL
jgi:DNA-binding NarL/FixJ family response regulator